MSEIKFLLVNLLFLLFVIANPINARYTESSESHNPAKDQHADANAIHHSDEEHAEGRHEKFEPGAFMFDHIGDAYSLHYFDTKTKSFSIPLPVILYSKEKGLVAFMSSKFEHGHNDYKGFRLETTGENKGKIVETLSNGKEVIPLDFSITKNIVALFVSIALIFFIFISIANTYKRNPNKPPKGLQSFIEPAIIFIRDELALPSIGEKKYEKFLPYLLTVFFFIFINNLLGLIPIPPFGANLTGNIAVTMVLALFTFIITNINGNKNYWQHIFNMPGVPIWLKVPPLPIMPIVETIGIFTKPIVLMIRLFANITAGHIIALGFLSLVFLFGEIKPFLGYSVSPISIAFMIFMTFLELLVAFIQAYVFTFLSALYIGMAVEEHH